MKLNLKIAVAGAVGVLATVGLVNAQAGVIDDFNVNEGHFALQPSYSGGSTCDTTSTADRVTTDSPLEGAGQQKIVLVFKEGATSFRSRHLSGGGTPANNTKITTTAGVDGKIGFYMKMPADTVTNWTVSLNLDGPTGAGAEMDGGKAKQVIPDGEWHLYEWDLDAADWGPVAGIGGGHTGGLLLNGDHYVDSIWITYTNTLPGPTTTLFLDYVAHNPAGSIADLLVQPCTTVPSLTIDTGPISALTTNITVKGVSGTATSIKAYQINGASTTVVGTKTAGIVEGTNTVTVSGLVAGAKIAATQVVGGQEGCTPTDGVLIGSGNPSVRIALSIMEPPQGANPAAIGEPMASTNKLHLLGSSLTAARDAKVFYPSNTWQTVTIERIVESLADPASASGATTTVSAGTSGYVGGLDTVSVVVYAYRTVDGTQIFSQNGAASGDVTSSSNFAVNWTWAAVIGAEGYRVVRTWNGTVAGAQDAIGTSFLDSRGDLDWTADVAVAQKGFQVTPSIQWNGDGSGATNLPGTWGGLDAIAFAVNGDCGPFDIYIDNLMNGTSVIHDFEPAPAGTAGYGFQRPAYSSTTDAGLLLGDTTAVSNLAADSGTKSARARWQFKSAMPGAWLRFTPYAAIAPQGYTSTSRPALRLDQPISFRMLLVPAGSPLPPAPPAPIISADVINAQTVLTWEGAHRLQAASSVAGPYTNVVQTLNLPTANTYLGPWTNDFVEPMKFFRLRD